MTIRKPVVRKRKEIMLNQIDTLSNLSKKGQEQGLLMFMQFIGQQDDCPDTLEPTDYIPPELDDDLTREDTSLFENSEFSFYF